MTYEQIRFAKEGQRAIITLNRPSKLNAMTEQMLSEMRQAMQETEADPNIRVLVLRAEGRGFCAGFDISPENAPGEGSVAWRRRFGLVNRMYQDLWDLTKPVVAQVHGACLGAGFELVMVADLAICSSDAFFGLPEVRFGGTVMFLTLPWLVGMKTAKQLLLTGENITADEAFRLQLVNRVVPRNDLSSAVDALSRQLITIPQGTLPLNKRLLNRTYEFTGLTEAVQLSEDLSVYAKTTLSDEAAEFNRIAHREGVKAAVQWLQNRFRTDEVPT